MPNQLLVGLSALDGWVHRGCYPIVCDGGIATTHLVIYIHFQDGTWLVRVQIV